ncbi:MAG: carbon storage regulator [Planctomycetaceae bacterium]|nr:carbon storage regulator [Planctomycetaceae bacterium]MBQ2822144.1 carbon storage regulator [Thermoguttaceae bacterium]MDO4424521.1 carbon storage regulator [Planctomycetia bacterium]
MLILSRRLDESLVIGGNIEVIITGISGNKVSLGIAAPPDVSVFRKELCASPREQTAGNPSSSSRKKYWKTSVNVQSLTTFIR